MSDAPGPPADPAVPDLGSPHVVAELRGRVLHLRLDRVDRRNAVTQDMYRALKRAAVRADAEAELDAHVDEVLAGIARTGPRARAAVKREINRRLPAADVGLFADAIRSPEMVEGMRAFVEKRPPVWPR